MAYSSRPHKRPRQLPSNRVVVHIPSLYRRLSIRMEGALLQPSLSDKVIFASAGPIQPTFRIFTPCQDHVSCSGAVSSKEVNSDPRALREEEGIVRISWGGCLRRGRDCR